MLPTPLALDEVVDHVHRPRPIERIQRRQLLHRIRLVAPQNVPHPARLKLKNPRRQRRVKYLLECLRIVERNHLDVQLLPARLLDQLHAIVDHRQRREAQEVHLQQAHLFDGLHVIGGHDFVVLRPVQRHKLRQRTRRNHHRRCMHPGPAHQPFQLLRRIDQLADLLVVVIGLAQIGQLFERLVDRHPHRRRHQLGDAVYIAVGHIHRASAVLDRGLRRHGVEGDDLRHLLASVLARHVVDHFAAPVHAEVHVDIRHRHALGIQEPLEEQHVLHRIDIRNLHRIGHQRSRRRSAPRSHGNAMIARVLDEVPHNQEVARVLHLLDDADLVLEPRLILLQLSSVRTPRSSSCRTAVSSRFLNPSRHTCSK